MPKNYSFVKRLGRGAEGDVWLAVDGDTNSLVAVKMVPRGPPTWRLTMIGREVRRCGGLAWYAGMLGAVQRVMR